MSIKTDFHQIGMQATPRENFILTPGGAAGALSLQRGIPGGVVSTPVVINNDDSVSANLVPNWQPSFRNKLLNGMMGYYQFSSTVDTSVLPNTYIVDGWMARAGNTLNKMTTLIQGPRTDGPEGLPFCLASTMGATRALAAGEYLAIGQNVEGVKLRDLMSGYPAARPMSVSFWIASTQPGTYALSVRNGTSDTSYVAPFTINAANVWEKKTFSIPACTIGNWPTGTTSGMQFWVSYATGSNFITPTPNAWVAGNYLGTVGSANSITNNAVFTLTGAQLETGMFATPFEHRDYVFELYLSRRYYQTISVKPCGITYTPNGDTRAEPYLFPVPMRVAPTHNAPGTVSVIGCGSTADVVNVNPTLTWNVDYFYLLCSNISNPAVLAPVGAVCAWGANSMYGVTLDARL